MTDCPQCGKPLSHLLLRVDGRLNLENGEWIRELVSMNQPVCPQCYEELSDKELEALGIQEQLYFF